MGLDMAIHLVHMMDLREAPLVEGQVGMVLENLRVQHWDSHLVQNLELRKVIMLEIHMGRLLGSKMRYLQGYLTRLQGWTWLQDISHWAWMWRK